MWSNATSSQSDGNRSMSDDRFAFDHVHLISDDPHAAASWYADVFGAEIVRESVLRDAPQISLRAGGMTLLIRGKRPGEAPRTRTPMTDFDDYSSHDEWGIDHFGFTYHGELRSLCDTLREKGVDFAVEPWEFVPGAWICFVAAPDGVSIEIVQARRE